LRPRFCASRCRCSWLAFLWMRRAGTRAARRTQAPAEPVSRAHIDHTQRYNLNLSCGDDSLSLTTTVWWTSGRHSAAMPPANDALFVPVPQQADRRQPSPEQYWKVKNAHANRPSFRPEGRKRRAAALLQDAPSPAQPLRQASDSTSPISTFGLPTALPGTAALRARASSPAVSGSPSAAFPRRGGSPSTLEC